MVEEKVEEKLVVNKTDKFTSRLRQNPWIISTVIFAVFALILLFSSGSGITGNVISADDAGQKFVSFINNNVGGGVTLISTKDIGSFYEVNVSYQGSNIPVYVTKDGQFYTLTLAKMISTTSSTTTPQTQTEVPKSDKPKVEAFVFSYCPYGLQFEKALLPVYNVLKNKADINIVYIGAMHGEYEKTESLRQLAILKEYGKDKLFAYLEKFNADTSIGSCNGNDACLNPLLDKLYSSLGIDKAKINADMTNGVAQALYDADVARASSLGISGSPTFVINGVETQVSRTPSAILTAICSAFNTQPSECSQALSSTSPSAGFGASTGSTSAASCG